MASRKIRKSQPGVIERPVIFGYHDYRLFLRDWFVHMKAEKRENTLRAIARKAGLSCAYLPSVLARTRNLSVKAFETLVPLLGLEQEERVFLGLLRILSDSNSETARRDALEQIQRFRGYQKFNPEEFAVYQYLEKWYHVGIREMAALPDFKADPQWISDRLKGKVSLPEIKQALRFLSENGYLQILPDGSAKLLDKQLDCVDSVYRIALRRFHGQIFQLAAEEMGGDNPPEERFVMGHTVAFPLKRLDEVKKIIGEAIKDIEKLAKNAGGADSLYHTSFFAIPLAKREQEKTK